MLTSGALSGLQEFLASWIAHDKNKTGGYFTSRVPKMAMYGAFISAPMAHVLIRILQWFFEGRTSVRAKVMQILASNLIVCVIDLTQQFCIVSLLKPDFLGCPNPKLGLLGLHGHHCRCSYLPSNPCHGSSWFLARNEGQLDYITYLPGICPAIPTTRNLGSVLQSRCLRHWNIHQPTYKEEEACSFAEETLR